jgi:hypothetical protein
VSASLLVVLLAQPLRLCAGPATAGSPASGTDYEQPKVLVGNILTQGAGSKKLLFKSQRSATRAGDTVHVTCEYTAPDGSLAARDRMTYRAGQLVSSETEEFQTGEKGVAMVGPDPKHPGQRRVLYEYTIGQGAKAKKSSSSASLEDNTLVDDMIPNFIVSHWDTLAKGTPVKFRYIALSRLETVGFRLVLDSETTWRRQPALRVKMEPTSFIIAQLVDPVFFIMEKAGTHRVFEYIGRTTPMLKDGNKWKDLDADTVFEYPSEVAAKSIPAP